MKKKYLSLLLIILLMQLIILPVLIALDFTLLKTSYQPSETLQAEISGNFPDGIDKDNIFLYRQGQNNHIATIYDLIKYNDVYYLYMVLPNSEGNYSIKIQDTKYIDAGIEIEEDIVKDINIKKTGAGLSISPGFVSAIKDFSITITSLNANQDITAEFEATKEKQTFNLKEAETKKLTFSLSGINKTIKSNLKINTYNIPVFITGSSGQDSFTQLSSLIGFSLSKIQTPLLKNKLYSFTIIIQNIGKNNLTNIILSSEGANIDIKIEPSSFDFLQIGEESTIKLDITINKKATNSVNGSLIASYDNKKSKLPLIFKITTNASEVNLTGTSVTGQLSCKALGGKVCTNYTEPCVGGEVASLDGNCCKGECKKESSGGGGGWIIGIIIIIIVVGIIAFIIIKKKRQKTLNPEDIIKQRAEKKGRLPEEESKEVRKKLERV